MQGLNIFLYGLSGAGKDTIANYLRDEYGYLKLRIAGTIKQYVFETNGFESQEQFEEEKRKRQEVRQQHHTFGKQYDEDGLKLSNREATYNRIQSLINRTALEFEISDEMPLREICIVDVRTFEEAKMFLEAGYMGIFLTRQNKKEFADTKHKTEQNLFDQIEQLPNRENIYIIRNHDNCKEDSFGWFGLNENNVPKFYTFETDGSEVELLEELDICIGYYLDNKKLR